MRPRTKTCCLDWFLLISWQPGATSPITGVDNDHYRETGYYYKEEKVPLHVPLDYVKE